MHSYPGRVTGRHSVLAESEGPEILTDELWDAEPRAAANPAIALRLQSTRPVRRVRYIGSFGGERMLS